MKSSASNIITFIFLVVSLLGCKNSEDKHKESDNKPAVENTEKVNQEEDEVVKAEPEYEPISKTEAMDFVETWSKIYTTHTFDNYIKLYEPRGFVGIKRTFQGEKNVYDFAGWVTNKKNEFKKFKPEVIVEDIKVKYLNQDNRTKVSFLQKWYSTTSEYADQGEKVLILIKKKGEIYIEKEELLYSESLVYEYGD